MYRHLGYSLSFLIIIGVSPILCRMKCNRPILANGRARVKSRGLIVQFKCSRGYSMLGEPYAACLRGKWEPEPPVCLKAGCYPIRSFRNGFITESNGKALLEFSCKPGYKLIGPSFIYCNGREWSSMQPYCKASDISCNFEEDDTCSWAVDAHDDDDFMWHVQTHKAASRVLGTGPEHDHTLSPNDTGHYLMIETGDYGPQVYPARLHSPKFPVPSNNNSCFIFWYHMFGSTVGMLNVFLNNKPVFQASGNRGDRWIKGIVPLTQNATDLQLIIEGTHGKGNTGNIGLDDFSIANSSDCENIPVTSCKGRCNEEMPDTASCLCTPECFVDSSCCDDFVEYCSSGISTSASSDSPDYETDFTENSEDTVATETESNILSSSAISSEVDFFDSTTGVTQQLKTTPTLSTKGSEYTIAYTKTLHTTPSPHNTDVDEKSVSTLFAPLKTTKRPINDGTKTGLSSLLYLEKTDKTTSSGRIFTKLSSISHDKITDEIITLPNINMYTTDTYNPTITQKHENVTSYTFSTKKYATNNSLEMITKTPTTVFVPNVTISSKSNIKQTNSLTSKASNNLISTIGTTMPTINHLTTKILIVRPINEKSTSTHPVVSKNQTLNPFTVKSTIMKHDGTKSTKSKTFSTQKQNFTTKPVVLSVTKSHLTSNKGTVGPHTSEPMTISSFTTKSATDKTYTMKRVTASNSDVTKATSTNSLVSKFITTIKPLKNNVTSTSPIIKTHLPSSPLTIKSTTSTSVTPKKETTTPSRANIITTVNPPFKKIMTINPKKLFTKKVDPKKYFTGAQKHITKSIVYTKFVNITTPLSTPTIEFKDKFSFKNKSKFQLNLSTTQAIGLTSLHNLGTQKHNSNSKTAHFNNVLKSKSKTYPTRENVPTTITEAKHESTSSIAMTDSIKEDTRNNTDVTPEYFSNPKGNFNSFELGAFGSNSDVKTYLVPGIIIIIVIVIFGTVSIYFFTKRRSSFQYRNGSEGDILYVSSEEMFDFNLARPSTSSS